MGQAKRRGTFQQRRELAIGKRNQSLVESARLRAEQKRLEDDEADKNYDSERPYGSHMDKFMMYGLAIATVSAMIAGPVCGYQIRRKRGRR